MKTKFLLPTLFVFLSFAMVSAQSANLKMIKLKGKVTDSEGFPIQKGEVFADSLKTGFRSNKKGEFKLRIPLETDIISVFSEEYGMLSEVYNGQEEINFSFPKNKEVITEIELSKLGYVFDVDVFRNVGKKSYSDYPDIFQIIREKFSGVQVTSDGSIIVRGFIGGDQTPLYIVDGNYVSGIDFINPDELKSIELLKGEDSALYGARGAPGVFVITLKK